MLQHARNAPRPPSQVTTRPIPDRLEQIVMACLEKAKDKRPSSAIELWRQLGEVPLTSPWTPERAESWWMEHLPELAAPPPAGDSSSDVIVLPDQ
jgi:serine/threonine-protein kinase